jgi:hypothetical protein
MIAHLFGKVYLNFDATFKPAFDTLIVSSNPIVPHDSFINQHIGMGVNHGKYNHASYVPWKEFFESVNDRRTVIYADNVSFPVVYFNFLKTINPNISYENAVKILEVVLKRAKFYLAEYDSFGGANSEGQKERVVDSVNKIRQQYSAAWAESKPFELSQEYVTNNLGIEFLLARYWQDGRNEALLKQKLEAVWWKAFVQWGEELRKNYSWRWLHENPGSMIEMFLSEISQNEDTAWMADPNLDLEKAELFRASHDWSTIEKIYQHILADQETGLIIEMHEQWTPIVNRDWSAILDKNNPLPVMAIGTEPIYRVLINTWLMSYFASKSTQTLGEMVA